MALDKQKLIITIVGILGNITSGLVYLAPLPTYYRIYQKKSTQGFQAVPYVVALFSATLWLYYALLKKEEIFLISINSAGCIIEALYLAFYCAYTSRNNLISTAKLIFYVNLVILAVIVLIIQLVLGDNIKRVKVLGIICAVVSIAVFAAPLAIMVKVFRTKSVEFMPFPLSFFLTLCAVIWFGYGLLRDDIFIYIPNIFGFVLGVLQMALYVACKNCCFANDTDRNPNNQSLNFSSFCCFSNENLDAVDRDQRTDTDQQRRNHIEDQHDTGNEVQPKLPTSLPAV